MFFCCYPDKIIKISYFFCLLSCEAPVNKIQKIHMGKGKMFICGWMNCLKSFCEFDAFKSHTDEVHGGSSSSVKNGGN